eukprot:TRINITY_DN46896_c0_g1_i1.p1 TRINITY_DN46896_c0_g1~~TRINITY_DN46896_c0_g1_i1.p1  ORF type:complete len:435 (-),score=28.30 TRINITY_DN46896_c0_g1_i1:8-1312(-)
MATTTTSSSSSSSTNVQSQLKRSRDTVPPYSLLISDLKHIVEPVIEGGQEAIEDKFVTTGIISHDSPTITMSVPQQGNPPVQAVLKFPVNGTSIVPYCQVAGFGKGEQTVVDTSIRNTYELKPEHFSLNANWTEQHLQPNGSLLQKIRRDLAFDVPHVEAELYKLLVYPTGSFFKPHVDSKKHPRMFGTLVIQIPTLYTGGALKVWHGGAVATITQSCRLPWDRERPEDKTHWAAFFASCKHEFTPVETGCRVCLVYNLLRPEGPVTAPPTTFSDKAVSVINQLATHPDRNDTHIGIFCGHSYAWSSIQGDVPQLNGIDCTLYHAIKRRYKVFVVQVHITRVGDGDGDEADFDTDEIDIIQGGPDEQYSVRWIVDNWELAEFDDREEEGPTGNEGNPCTEWYKHTAIVCDLRGLIPPFNKRQRVEIKPPEQNSG